MLFNFFFIVFSSLSNPRVCRKKSNCNCQLSWLHILYVLKTSRTIISQGRIIHRLCQFSGRGLKIKWDKIKNYADTLRKIGELTQKPNEIRQLRKPNQRRYDIGAVANYKSSRNHFYEPKTHIQNKILFIIGKIIKF